MSGTNIILLPFSQFQHSLWLNINLKYSIVWLDNSNENFALQHVDNVVTLRSIFGEYGIQSEKHCLPVSLEFEFISKPFSLPTLLRKSRWLTAYSVPFRYAAFWYYIETRGTRGQWEYSNFVHLYIQSIHRPLEEYRMTFLNAPRQSIVIVSVLQKGCL